MSFALIIPCYNFEAGLQKTFERISEWRRTTDNKCSVWFVNDGSTDQTSAVLKGLSTRAPDWCHAVELPKNRGKGAAIRTAFNTILSTAKTPVDHVLFTDCDLHYGLEIISDRILPALAENDVVIVDRSWSASASHEALARRMASGFFNRAMAILTGVSFRDSQAGLKAFRVERCRPVFELLTMDGFTFDVEFLSIALFYRLRILQIPLRFVKSYEFPRTTSIRLLRASLLMLRDLFQININWKRGRYRHPKLEAAVDQTAYFIK